MHGIPKGLPFGCFFGDFLSKRKSPPAARSGEVRLSQKVNSEGRDGSSCKKSQITQ
jgi:hypothetical protein